MFQNMFNSFLAGVHAYVLFALLCTIIEIVVAGERQTWLSRLRGFAFSTTWIASTTLMSLLSAAILNTLGIGPLLHFDLTKAPDSENRLLVFLGYTLFPILSALVYDIFYYWFHRLQHCIPFLWRFHATHHSIQELNSFNSYHHIFEDLFRIPLLVIPMTVLIRLDVPQVAFVAFLTSVAMILAHANTKIKFGPLRYVVTEPRYHRIHHSIERKHWDLNFAFLFPVWDMVSGPPISPLLMSFPGQGSPI